MDARNILEIYGTGGKIQKAMHKNKVIWEPDRRKPATVFFQEIEFNGALPITEEAVRKCLEKSKFRIAYINGVKDSGQATKFISHNKTQFGEPPQGKIFICAMTEMRFYWPSLVSATKLGLIPYHIFENVIKIKIDPDLYAANIQPVIDKLGAEQVKSITEFYRKNRRDMREKYIAIGDRDGVSVKEMLATLDSSDINVAANTESSYINTVDYKEEVNEYIALYNGPADFIIGAAEVKSAEGIATEAKKRGIKTYHILEPEIKDRCDPDVYDEHAGMMEMVLDAEALCNAVEKIRNS